MNAHFAVPADAVAIEARFVELCDNRALLYIEGVLDLHEAVDECQGYAVLAGIVDHIGQDATQHIMAVAFAAPNLVPDIEQVNFEIGDIVRRWELADSRDRWKHTGEAPPTGSSSEPIFRRQLCSTPQATVDAFWSVAELCDSARLKSWLADHPQDRPYLLKLLRAT